MNITNCKINHLINPLGFDLTRPTVSYLIEQAEGERQQWARIRVADDEAMTNVLYDSGKKEEINPLSHRLPVDLRPRTRYWWQVEAETDASDYGKGEVQCFETGKMNEEWQAKWITCDSEVKRHPIFAKELPLEKNVASARLYITCQGLYEAYLNGECISEERLTPYCNNYHQWTQVQTFDITDQLAKGGKMEIWLGNGWYKGRFGFVDYDRSAPGTYGNTWAVIAEIRVCYEDGTEAVFGTDESWMVKRSCIMDSNLYDGEIIDLNAPEAEMVPAALYEGPFEPLHDRLSPPVRVQQIVHPVEKIVTPKGEQMLDLGQNLAGMFRLHVKEPKGTVIKLHFAEIMQNDCFYRDNLRSALAEYTFITDGEEHIIEPHFTFYGYRYVWIEGIKDVKPEDFQALVLHSDLPEAGQIETGHEKINRLLLNAQWGMKGNFIDVPTDCPQRDERMGWTGDAQVFSATACFFRDCYAFYRKYLYDMEQEQLVHDGMVPDVIPAFTLNCCATVWGDASTIIPWNLYRYHGDVSILEQCYESMKMWVNAITRMDGDDHGWRTHAHYGDWLALDHPNPKDIVHGGTDEAFIADVYYRHSAMLTAKAARILGKTEDAEYFTALADRLLKEIREEYFTPTGRLAIPTQTAHVLALAYGLTEDVERTRKDLAWAFEHGGGGLKTGFTGTPLLCNVLSANGMDELAYKILLREEYPGWLYCINLGATTIWERWNSLLPDGTISDTGMNSFNHYSYGSIAEWIWRRGAGMEPIEEEPGFRKIRLRPMPHRALGSVKASFLSASGRWESAWEIDGDELTIRFTVPFGCEAEVELPYAPEGMNYGTVGAGTYEIHYKPTRILE